MTWQTILDVLNLATSLPVIALFLILIFKKKLSVLLDVIVEGIRIRGLILKSPGGREIQMPPLQAESETRIVGEGEESITALATEKHEALTGRIQKMESDVTLWKFNYLYLFLVPNTKSVLRWIANNPSGILWETYAAVWGSTITGPDQLRITYDVLLINELIEEKDGITKISQTGTQFINFLDKVSGPPILPVPKLPVPPPPPSS